MRLPSYKAIAVMAALAPTSALTDPLSDMEGSWRGTGWARQNAEGPQETVRCQINNSYDHATATLMVKGKCVVPGRRLALAGSIDGSDPTGIITGRWFNPDGLGSTRIRGMQQGPVVAFIFNTKDPKTGGTLSQNVEWKVSTTTLRLRSSDANTANTMMSDISFTR